ncbi:MAG TPA: UDP-N-acetylmuramoyl-L-alanine--D-glutamate ligase, partial [Chloroflexi bacterium]|nr:UDP-N-acetylmuramoyl-L-alanine--D-glutamate ligase [Chloroflexota bacterium]
MRGSHVIILGLARQGKALARFLAREGARVTVSDLRDPDELAGTLDELADVPADVPLRYVLGEHPLSLLDGADLLCLSGGVPLDIPIVEEARARGIPL